MSKRRSPGEIVKRKAGSGFVGSEEPSFVKVPEGKTYEFDTIKDSNGNWMANEGGEASRCMMGCKDPECREWANLEIVTGPHKGNVIYHISECQMEDLPWTADQRFLFALYYALRDISPEERRSVYQRALHDAECPGNCDACQSEITEPDPDWLPPAGKWNRYPYAALQADMRRWAREEP